MKKIALMLGLVMLVASCATVGSGHQGVAISWGGETDMSQVYNEGVHYGFHWIVDEMKDYDSRQKTVRIKTTLLDVDGLSVPIEAVLYYEIMPGTANKLHKKIGGDFEVSKITPLFQTALKNVVTKYKALDLNVSKRDEADAHLRLLLDKELAEIFILGQGANIIDIDIPKEISDMIVAKQTQDEKNKLAEKKKLEETNIAAANLEKAKGAFLAAEFDAKTKAILSRPEMLKLKELEIDAIWATKGVSKYGNNNVFGAGVTVLKGLQ